MYKVGLSRRGDLRRSLSLRDKSSGFSNLSSRFWDVIRSRSLQPPNPILTSLDNESGTKLPEFSRMLPHHLDSSAIESAKQYRVELAETEVALTAAVGEDNLKSMPDLLNRLDALNSPIAQITEVGCLFTELAALPDQLSQWKTAHEKAKSIVDKKIQPFTQSKIIHKAMLEMAAETNENSFPLHLRLAFEKEGVSEDDKEIKQQLEEIQSELSSLEENLSNLASSSRGFSKAARLQTVRCMYNIIGLSHLQAQQLSYPTVSSMAMAAHNNITQTPEEVFGIQRDVAEFLKPHLPDVKVTLDKDAGAFLPSSAPKAPSESEKELWRAKSSVKKLFFLHGALQGVFDFFESIFGIQVVEDTDASNFVWNKNVRVLRLHDTETDIHMGTIYLDLFRDAYWRSPDASDVIMTRLFSRCHNQTRAPLAVIGLSIDPSWDDAPTPVTWKDFQDLLHQFGMALQQILWQKSCMDRSTPFSVQPADTSEFLAKFMTMWIHNDGFLQRIAQLSQDQFVFQPELMRVLRDDLKKQKALDSMETIFLSHLELEIFTDFDPRGDETLVSLQKRLAQQYIPHNVPDATDLSPLIEVFQGKSIDPSMRAFSPLCSEILAAMAYDKFANTDLKDEDAVKRLGRGIRNLFTSEDSAGKESIEKLSETPFTPRSLKKVYDF